MIQSQPRHAGLSPSLSVMAIASALFVLGFVMGQLTPNLAGSLDLSIGAQPVAAPVLTRADDHALRHPAPAAGLTRADDYALRHAAVATLTRIDDYATRHVPAAVTLTEQDDFGTRH